MMGVSVERAERRDAGEILALQKLAYQSEADLYQDYTILPLTQTLEQIASEFDEQMFLKAVENGRIVGSVRAYQDEGTCYVGRLIVHPDAQGRGIGQQLMDAIEGAFPEASRFELFTGHLSERNIRFYQKLGYRCFRQRELSGSVSLVYMQKFPASGAE
jgi:ribosomal protein S18 acetylase RimI-like enzyme